MTNKTQLNNLSLRWQGHQRRIGITGGIATGKTTIGNFLRVQKKWPILDADIYAKEALKPGTFHSQKVLSRYGERVINSKNHDKEIIDRSLLSQIIFNDKKERLWLEKLIHPTIINSLQKGLIVYESSPVVILIIPLLFEVGLNNICSEVWLINCTKEQQLKRLMLRNNITITEANQIINAQWSLDKKKDLADFIIHNDDEFCSWKKQVNKII